MSWVSRRAHLLNLWEADPHCHYCGRLTVMAESGKKYLEGIPGNTATRDHLYSRLDPRRHDKSNPHRLDVVLSCYDCNWARNEIEQKRVPSHIRAALSNKQITFVENFEPHYPLTKA